MMLYGCICGLVLLVVSAGAFSPATRSCNHRHAVHRWLLTYSADEQNDIQVTESTQVIRPEFAVLFPGSQIAIQVGNLDLARKAWKKRRRSGSPMLIPCSILHTDRKSMVINNLVFLLRKFGTPMAEQEMHERPDGFKSHHIAIALPDLSRWYKSHLRASLAQHATALGYKSASDLIQDVITPQLEEEYGIKLWTVGNQSWVVARVSKMRGQRLAAQMPLLQFIEGEDNVMMHTGKTRVKIDSGPGSFRLEPMSAALRVSQRVIDSGSIATGSIHQGSFVGIDPMGDAGLPLLKASLNVPNDIKSRKISRSQSPSIEGKALEHNLNELLPGQGPFVGRVVHISGRSGAAFIDIGVGRTSKRQSADNKGMTRVLGMLRFDDLVRDMSSSAEAFMNDADDEVNRVEEALNSMEYIEDDDRDIDVSGDEEGDIFSDFTMDELFEGEGEEIVEDISHLVTLEGGKYTFRDPDSGESIDLGGLYEDGDQIVVDDDQEDDFFAGLTPSERLEKLGDIMDDDEQSDSDDQGTATLRIGDSIGVYIQAVSKQSGRFMVTTRSSGPNMKELKQEIKSNKNLERLLTRFDGEMNNILTLVGEEGEGIVKAISKTGDWLYVQPQFRDLPVGVAQVTSDIPLTSLSEGDNVRIRLDGIDEFRGQLSMTVIAKN
jgi:hypothetical protein